nr:hypothetical protein GCM10017745_18270 [Saccharothrix mutabilis subsp. capreolus]
MSGFRAPSEAHSVDRKALWVVRELGLPTIVKTCMTCRCTRHHPTDKFRVNASGKLLDVWMLVGCEKCDRTTKIPLHERIHVQALAHDRLVAYEDNDPAMVRRLLHEAPAGGPGYRLDWTGTWELDIDMPFYEVEREDAPPLEVLVRFEVPAPVRVENLLTAGLKLSRSAVRGMACAGRIRLPSAVDAKVRADFTFFVLPGSPARH